MKNRFIFLWLVLSCVLILNAASSASASMTGLRVPEALTPIADTSCALGDRQREGRIRFMAEQVAIQEQLREATRHALQTDLDSLKWMSRGYKASKVCLAVSLVAGTISGVGSIYSVFAAGQATTVLGYTLPLAVSKGVTVVSTGYSVLTLPRDLGMIFSSLPREGLASAIREAEERAGIRLDQVHKNHEDALQGVPLVGAGGLRFLSSPDCSGTRCPVVQPELETAWKRLGGWREAGLRRMKAEDRWWKFEAYTHLYGRTLSEIEIPWAVNAIQLTDLKEAYARLLLQILVHDREACRRR